MSITVKNAQVADYAEVLALLRQVNLPSEGVQEHFNQFLVARDAAGDLMGCVGLEHHGELVLLRSLAVRSASQGTGLGRELVLGALSAAHAWQAKEIVLLTTTAAEFFERHFGFERVERTVYDETLAASPEWHLPRCSSAVCMRLLLT